MKTLITGGAGFIGSHLAQRLSSNDQQIVVLDDLSAGNKENLTILKEFKNISIIKAQF